MIVKYSRRFVASSTPDPGPGSGRDLCRKMSCVFITACSSGLAWPALAWGQHELDSYICIPCPGPATNISYTGQLCSKQCIQAARVPRPRPATLHPGARPGSHLSPGHGHPTAGTRPLSSFELCLIPAPPTPAIGVLLYSYTFSSEKTVRLILKFDQVLQTALAWAGVPEIPGLILGSNRARNKGSRTFHNLGGGPNFRSAYCV